MEKHDHHYVKKLTQKDWGERQQTLTWLPWSFEQFDVQAFGMEVSWSTDMYSSDTYGFHCTK